jgi:hypothetical protein
LFGRSAAWQQESQFQRPIAALLFFQVPSARFERIIQGKQTDKFPCFAFDDGHSIPIARSEIGITRIEVVKSPSSF